MIKDDVNREDSGRSVRLGGSRAQSDHDKRQPGRPAERCIDCQLLLCQAEAMDLSL